MAVRVVPTPTGVRVQGSDTGCGIDLAFLPFLYGEFRQASEGHDRVHEGNGLGLAITRRLVDLMDGTIEVESAVEVGTTFTVTLPPARLADVAPAVAARTRPGLVEDGPRVQAVSAQAGAS